MFTALLLSLAAQAAPATFTENGTELISDRRDVSELQAQVEPLAESFGACAEHTGGANYGVLGVSFMVDKRGKTANPSIRSEYLLPKALTECLSDVVAEVQLGRGDVAVAKVGVRLP